MCNKFFNSQRGAIGETITWVPGTIIIVALLIIFLIFSSLLAGIKVVNISEVKSDVDDSPVLSVKTSLAHQLAENKNKEIINNLLEEKNAKKS
jgi:hypothetical protein